MRLNVMFGLDHVADDRKHAEAIRLLADLSALLEAEDKALKPGDSFVLKDAEGKRIGVADVFKH